MRTGWEHGQALRESAQAYVEFLTGEEELQVADICYTAAVGRTHFAHRLCLRCKSAGDLREQLQSFVGDCGPGVGEVGHVRPGQAVNVGIVFLEAVAVGAGQVKALHDEQPAFRTAFDACVAAAEAQRPGSASHLLRVLDLWQLLVAQSPRQASRPSCTS